MNKTIYLRDEEGPIWERARELAGEKLSPVILAALRDFIAAKEAEMKGFERIVLQFNDSLDNNLPKAKAFYGRWIIDLQKPLILSEDSSGAEFFSVAETVKGNIVVYTHTEGPDWVGNYSMFIYPSLQEAAADHRVNYAIREAVERRGVPVEELDI